MIDPRQMSREILLPGDATATDRSGARCPFHILRLAAMCAPLLPKRHHAMGRTGEWGVDCPPG